MKKLRMFAAAPGNWWDSFTIKYQCAYNYAMFCIFEYSFLGGNKHVDRDVKMVRHAHFPSGGSIKQIEYYYQ